VSEAKAKEPKSASARKNAEAAAAETKAEGKVIDFRGLKLTIADEPMGTILFDIADLEGGREFTGSMEMIKSLLGPDQYKALRNKVAEDGLKLGEMEEALADLVGDILEASGLGQGE
jgi:hypothetical protein